MFSRMGSSMVREGVKLKAPRPLHCARLPACLPASLSYSCLRPRPATKRWYDMVDTEDELQAEGDGGAVGEGEGAKAGPGDKLQKRRAGGLEGPGAGLWTPQPAVLGAVGAGVATPAALIRYACGGAIACRGVDRVRVPDSAYTYTFSKPLEATPLPAPGPRPCTLDPGP